MVQPEPRPSIGPSTEVDHETDGADLPSSSRPDWLERGETIGRYMVLECLGVGGMGVIYSAWDPKLDRKLAIKVVRGRRRGQAGSTRGRARLLREGQALARLRHPNVISVHDVGTHEGRVFVAMEFVEGQTLYRWLQRSPRPPTRQLIDVFLQVGRGLAAAHRAGLVHRDVKPENVMIGDDGRVMVLDFGIARAGYGSESDLIEDPELDEALGSDELERIGAEDSPDPEAAEPVPRSASSLMSLTRAGAVVGTPAYMSPEQHRGRSVDARSDQFSYCVAMWEALNAEKPYGDGSRQKLLARMRLGQLRPVRNRELPRRITVALRRGLSWHPGDRFESMEALLEALNPRGHNAEQRLWHGLALGALVGMILGVVATMTSVALRDESTAAPPPCEDAGAALREHWSEARAEDIAERFDATGLARANASWVRARVRLDDWAARWTGARTEVCTAHFIEHRDSAALHDRRAACLEHGRARFVELVAAFESVDPMLVDGVVMSAASLPAPELCAELEHLHTLDQSWPEPESPDARQRLVELRGELDRLEQALAAGHWRAQLERSHQLAAAAREAQYPPLLARALRSEAAYLVQAGLRADAEALLLEAGRAAALAGDAEAQAQAHLEVAALIAQNGRPDEAQRWLELGASLAETAPGSLEVMAMLGSAAVARARGQLEPAREQLRQARLLLERDGDPELQLPMVLTELAQVTGALGDDDQALTLLRRALVLVERAEGPAHPRIGAIRSQLARTLERRGEHQAALGEYERALVLLEQVQGQGPETALLRSRIGAALARRGRCDEAWSPLERAVSDARADAPGSSVLATALEALAGACMSAHQDALALARAAVELREHQPSPDPPALAGALTIEALALVETGEPTLALERLERASTLLSSVAAPSLEHHAAESSLLAARGLTLLALGRDDEARPLLEQARPRLTPGDLLEPRVSQALSTRP